MSLVLWASFSSSAKAANLLKVVRGQENFSSVRGAGTISDGGKGAVSGSRRSTVEVVAAGGKAAAAAAILSFC